MKNIIILITTILFSINIVNAEEKKTLAKTLDWDGKCVAEHKISPDAISCAIKNSFRKLYTKKDGSLNALGKFFNAKSLADLNK